MNWNDDWKSGNLSLTRDGEFYRCDLRIGIYKLFAISDTPSKAVTGAISKIRDWHDQRPAFKE